jgi:hypothetical protein
MCQLRGEQYLKGWAGKMGQLGMKAGGDNHSHIVLNRPALAGCISFSTNPSPRSLLGFVSLLII